MEGYGQGQSCFLKLNKLDIEEDWKIIEKYNKSDEAFKKIINYEMFRVYKNTKSNKYIYSQKLKRLLDPSKNWDDYFSQIKALCNSCVAKAFTDLTPKPMKRSADKPVKSDYYGSMTFIATR